ncbi:uncharacterized protein SCODWIG_03101 [Saccharomycodes ludwigii]|uniref:SUN domain-containing protein n=1 Tax=Saccharomycodes ludwigii TaxID=36035 RepID=A0A376BB11_9ASCO|nr:uncharacterized protein SCODWIG_03101 [Saccharomycodes ludwigii]
MSSGSAVYNKSVNEAYEFILQNRLVNDQKQPSSNDHNHKGVLLSDDYEQDDYTTHTSNIGDHYVDYENYYYQKFKESLANDKNNNRNDENSIPSLDEDQKREEYDDDDDDDDYNEEANESFIDDETNQSFTEEDYTSGDEFENEKYDYGNNETTFIDRNIKSSSNAHNSYSYNHNNSNNKPRTKLKLRWGRILTLLFLLSFFFIKTFFYDFVNHHPNDGTLADNSHSHGEISKLQKQFAELYNETSNFKNVFKNLENTLQKYIYGKDYSINTNGSIRNDSALYKVWEDRFFDNLKLYLPKEIPVVIKNGNISNFTPAIRNDSNTTASLVMIPEFSTYLQKIFQNGTTNNITSKLKLSDELKYDLNNYVKEILLKEFQFVDKQFFISYIKQNYESLKNELLSKQREVSTTANTFDNKELQIFVERLVYRILKKSTAYTNNDITKDNEVNYASYLTGTKILNHLCSKTFQDVIVKGIWGNGITPIELLSLSSDTYWMCESKKNCQWSIRFKQPIYLTNVLYQHGRFTNNLALMNSCPKLITMYAEIITPTTIRTKDVFNKNAYVENSGDYEHLYNDYKYIKVGSLAYDLHGEKYNDLKQKIALPKWFINLKPLVKALSFVVEDNYGNEYYTSLNKFIVNGVTPYDLELMKQSATNNRQGTVNVNSNILSFYDDEREI